MEHFSHYPVRLPNGDVSCYKCANTILGRYNECARYESHQANIRRARESIESQIEHCRKALETEEQRWLLSQIAAERRDQI